MVFDRGCFHGVPVYDQEAYVKTVASVTEGGRLLPLNTGVSGLGARGQFEPYFAICHTHDTTLGGTHDEPVPGLSFRMKRSA
jgi:hypothetical protein